MKLTPRPGLIFVEPVLRSVAATDDLRQRAGKSGLLIQDSKPEFEGSPNTGRVYAVPDGETEIAVGDIVIFSTTPQPQGIKLDKLKLMAVPRIQIASLITEA